MQKNFFKSIAALVAIIATVLVMTFSATFLVQHHSHQCTGNECPICHVMEQCSNNLKTIGTAVIAVAAIVAIRETVKQLTTNSVGEFSCNSLVSQKVRLDN